MKIKINTLFVGDNELIFAKDLIKLPPFWNTVWFKILVFLVLTGSILLIFITRLKRIKRQRAELQELVKEKTKDLQDSNVLLEEKQAAIMQQKEELQSQADQLSESNAELEEKQEHIILQSQKLTKINKVLKIEQEQRLNSLRYAMTIQNAMLPSKSNIDKFFNCFILFMPKDIVSGDFYWFTHLSEENKTLFAVV